MKGDSRSLDSGGFKGSRVSGLGFRVWGLEPGLQNLGLKV